MSSLVPLKSIRTLNVLLGPQSGSFSQLLVQGRRVSQRDAMTEEDVGDFRRVRERVSLSTGSEIRGVKAQNLIH